MPSETRAIRSPIAGGAGGCEPSDVGAGHSLWLLQEQHTLLAAGSFLQLLKFIFKIL